jgi:hypothetical protein
LGQTPVAEPLAPRRTRSRRAPLILLAAAGALFASVLGYLLEDQIAAYAHYEQTKGAVAATHHREARVGRDLAVLRRELTTVTKKIESDTATLGQDQAKLKAAQAALAGVQADVSQQSTVIGALQSCLAGVQQALNALAINDQAGAIADLTSVGSSCTAGTGAG